MATIQQELAAVAPGPDPLGLRPIGDELEANGRPPSTEAVYRWQPAGQSVDAAAPLKVALHVIAAQGDQAVARVLTYREDGAPSYRQTRFYQRIGERWLPTAPDATLWGPERRLETRSFVFHFRQQDAAVVMAVATRIETLYTTLRRNVGLPSIPSAERLIIDVQITATPGRPSRWFDAAKRIIVPSPAVYWAPAEVTDAELLAQSIALPLLDDVIAKAAEYYGLGSGRHPMLRGVRLWQIWELDLPLAVWRRAVVSWLYRKLPADGSHQEGLLPDRYQEICAAHQIWMPTPLQIDIPLSCIDGKLEYRHFSLPGVREPLTHLEQLALLAPPNEYLGQWSGTQHHYPQGQTVALATVIEYAVATYGRECLPALLAGLGQYDSWETLLPTVYGVSSAEFEAGWQGYLADRYLVSIDTRQ
ncbi:MAG: hypothetical protein DYG89_34890 [Caldilinea sp. CFX5]|nr:hypothetical protein [Caldilinea sp. CFX5]